MALNVLQVEEFNNLLLEVPLLVDALEQRKPAFCEDVLIWLKHLECVLENNRLPAVAQIASYRAMLIQAGRGFHSKDITFTGKPTARKIHDATASLILQRASQLVQDVISERQNIFHEAERITNQLVVVAEVKGIIQGCRENKEHQIFLQCIQQKLSVDPDLISAYTHLVSLVGKQDSLIFLDRSIPAP